ncbi:MexE family multidrug efflux RND transporter periplasmic adaptor subunit [Desulfuromonas versatilis]|uniref:MexE family multidrug efflux RND transporter periplasmic adaptor subunit n=1 Tax=Desulfuromonas versatilis TaxID=2802975 RepID=A0ABN6E1Q7_9BACT|nr:efflux RND transporter periplasmic adaptor subunit [Desulfuromonas versatilis]BCR06282.1 MexE family multidrug efflux RND transporter periplasmic adaptor subunit [Desulfuromonas versatilis]
MKLKTNNMAMVISLAVMLFLGACTEQPQDVAVERGPVEVDVVTLKAQPTEVKMELPGRTTAFRVAEVRPQVSGIIQKRFFTEGSVVKAGELLYQIDPAVYQATFDSAKAALAKAKAVEHSARLKAERYATLVRTKAVSELDQVEIEASWKQAVADVAAAEAAMNSAAIDLDYTRVTAPISGHIGKSMISEGALVTAQQSTALATIQQLDHLYVDVTQSSTELARIKRDLSAGTLDSDENAKSQVTILLEDGSEYEQPGTLEFSDVSVDQSTGSVTLRIVVANPNEDLLPGMFVRARISSGVRQDAILIPAASISHNNKGEAYVMLVNNQSQVESRIIQSGRNMGDQVLVNEGLANGEQVITAGLQKVKPGITVKAFELNGSLTGKSALNVNQAASLAKAE